MFMYSTTATCLLGCLVLGRSHKACMLFAPEVYSGKFALMLFKVSARYHNCILPVHVL